MKCKAMRQLRALSALALVYALAACDSAPPPTDAESSQAPQVQAALPQPSPKWPFVVEGGAAVVSEDLLASNIYLVVDGSGSMSESGCSGGLRKVDAAKAAVRAFLTAVPTRTNVGLLVFDSRGIGERVGLGADNREQLNLAVDRISPSGGTPLRSAIAAAYERITAQARLQLGYGEYHMVVVTDGQPQPMSQDPRPIVDQVLAESPVIIHTIGFCIGEDHALNQAGRVIYKTATDQSSLREGLQGVLAEAPDFDVQSFGQQ